MPHSIYTFFLKIIKFILFKVYYKKVKIIHKSEIPNDCPIIFAANHQNGLIDPLLIICGYGKPITFFARADIFKNKTYAKILKFLKIEPIYRAKDNCNIVAENKKVFKKATELLLKKEPIAMFPEAQHNHFEHLLPLRKGLARIAFEAEVSENFNLNLMIIPVAISYSNYYNPKTEVRITFCEPIKIKNFKEEYSKNPIIAYNAFNARLTQAIKNEIVHHENEEEYQISRIIQEIYLQNKFGHNYDFFATFGIRKKIQDFLNSPEANALKNYVREYYDLQKNCLIQGKYRVFNDNLQSQLLNLLYLLFLFPLFVLVLVFNFFQVFLPLVLIKRVLLDKQFVASFSFVVSFVILMPLTFVLLFVYLKPVYALGAFIFALILSCCYFFVFDYLLKFNEFICFFRKIYDKRFLTIKTVESVIVGKISEYMKLNISC